MAKIIQTVNEIAQLLQSGFSDWEQFGHVYTKQLCDLFIFNYSAKAVFSGDWNFFECVSRGLIINRNTGEIVARPFDKFFNWGESDRITLSPIVTITEKMDGSLGILYRVDGVYRIATRGSFDGEQAQWATSFLDKYDFTDLSNELTLLFEIIYPENRIVVDYGGYSGLILLAARNRFTGEYLPFDEVIKLGKQYSLTLPPMFSFSDINAIIDSMDDLENAEGYVVEFADGQRFKFKSKRYFELHRMLSNLSFKSVLREIQNGTIDAFLETVPDEFLGDVNKWIDIIISTVESVLIDVKSAFNLAPTRTRKEFAQWVAVNHKDLAKYLFAKFDGKPIRPIVYKCYDWDLLRKEMNK